MLQFTASSHSKWAYAIKVLVLSTVSVVLLQFLWSNTAFANLTNIAKTNTYLTYIQLGATNFIDLGLGHVMFVLGIFLFGSKAKFVTKQLLAFCAAHIITLWLGMYAFHFSNYFIQALVPLTILYIAGENIYARKLKKPRVGAVFFCGLIHGLSMAGSLKETILMESDAKSLLLFNVGVELAIICFAIPAYMILVNLASGKTYSKLFFSISSAILVIAAACLTFNQILLPN